VAHPVQAAGVRAVRIGLARAAEGQGELSPVWRYHATAEGISPFTCPSTAEDVRGGAPMSAFTCGTETHRKGERHY